MIFCKLISSLNVYQYKVAQRWIWTCVLQAIIFTGFCGLRASKFLAMESHNEAKDFHNHWENLLNFDGFSKFFGTEHKRDVSITIWNWLCSTFLTSNICIWRFMLFVRFIQNVQWRSQDFRSVWTLKEVSRVGVRGGGRSPPDAGEFSKIFKNFLGKIAKNAIF